MYNQNENELMTIDEMCERLFIGKNAAYKLLNNQTIKAFRIGRVWKIPKSSIMEYISSYGYSADQKQDQSKRRNIR